VFKNALLSLLKTEHLTVRHASVGKGKATTLYERGPRFEDLTEIRRTLARALESHGS